MPRRKKNPREMTDAELIRRVFPRELVKALEEEVKDDDNTEEPPTKQSKGS